MEKLRKEKDELINKKKADELKSQKLVAEAKQKADLRVASIKVNLLFNLIILLDKIFNLNIKETI